MDRKEKLMMEALEKIQQGHEAELEGGCRKIAQNVFNHGMSPKEAMGMSTERVEHLYAEGFKLYNSGNFPKAIPYFESLTMLDGNDPRFVFALGACHHGLKHYKEALSCYMITCQLDADSPHPMFHAADCSLHLKDEVTALVFLQTAIDRSGDKAIWSELKERAVLTKQGILARLNSGGST